MNLRLAVCLFLLTAFPAAPLWAGSHAHLAKQADLIEPGYVSALAAANLFLHAWQTGDVESGMVQLSDHLRHSLAADKVEEFFSNAGSKSKSDNRAFEITRGRGHPGRYTFPVVLVTTRGPHVARKFSEVVVIDNGKNDWVVDKLP